MHLQSSILDEVNFFYILHFDALYTDRHLLIEYIFMSEVLFFPWLRVANPFYFSDFSLLPYDKGQIINDEDKWAVSELDHCFSYFCEHDDRPIESITILAIDNEIKVECDQVLESKLSVVIEKITFCGLSSRDFFGTHENYCNKDNFQLNRFPANDIPVAISVIQRRIVGSIKNIIPLENYRERALNHVCSATVNLDSKLLESLNVAQSKSEFWENIFQGVLNFNLANSDSSFISEGIEIVLLVSAFEKLLDANAKENILAPNFIQTLNASSKTGIYKCKKLENKKIRQRFKKVDSVEEYWIRDLFRLRGNIAHGNKPSAYPSIWSVKEHLCFGSFIFPLVLKAFLHEKDMYIKTVDDELRINIFGSLLCQESMQEWKVAWADFLWDKAYE